MALISPGVDVTVIDESQYAPSGGGTVPYVLIATAQDKKSGTGGGAAIGTNIANADRVSIVTSQRELVSLYGDPIFRSTSTGTPINGSELNEYGLMTAYSLLGVTNRVYVQRANINLEELIGTGVRPTNDPSDGTYWFDVDNTSWGLFEWNSSTQLFESIKPIVIEDVAQLLFGVPVAAIGNIGDYAVTVTSVNNNVFYKNYNNQWVAVGTPEWNLANFAVQSTVVNPEIEPADVLQLLINGITVTLSGTTIASLVTAIDAANIPGITARDNLGKLEIFVSSTAASNGTVADGFMLISDVGNVGALATLGITPGSYAAPKLQVSSHTQVPAWKSFQEGRPTGSLWAKTTSANGGANLSLSVYSLAVDSFLNLATPIYVNDQTALRSLDARNGGLNISAGTTYAQYDAESNGTLTYKLLKRDKQGTTTVTGTLTPSNISGGVFSISSSLTGVTELSDVVTITVPGPGAEGMVAGILAANIPNITAQVAAGGFVSITHTKGGVFYLQDGTGTPLALAGITIATDYVRETATGMLVSNFVEFNYTAASAAPNSDPANGRLWYYSNAGDVDIMVHDGASWRGYRGVSADARGYNLSQTYAGGVIVAASDPETAPDGDPLVFGDLWIDTADLENYPQLYRWSNVEGTGRWLQVDKSDQTSENGILFADARWDIDGTSNAVADELTPTTTLLTSDYIAPDAPESELYPRGMLLFNTRRSGYNVKRFVKNYFNTDDFSGSLPAEKDAWVTAAGLKSDGSPYMGRQAVRKMVVTAMQAAIASSTELREEQREFTLIAAPGYPELIPAMVGLNNDRRNTAFVVGDTPMRLSSSASAVQDWANDVNLQGTGEFGLATSDPFLAVYYPAAQTNDLSGNSIVVPASYIALRTLVRSDNVSYPWFAAAGVRRGLVDNASSIGYIDSTTGEFNRIGVTEGLRDTLYESRINPITFLTGVGLVVYGNKSLGVSGSALDRINVSRLVVYLRRVVDLAARNFVFEPNDKITRDELKQVIERALNDLVAKRAITDYLVVCDESNNTPVRRDRNELYCDIAIEPVKAAEFIYLPIRVKAQGAISGN
jgi:hypothetical protein